MKTIEQAAQQMWHDEHSEIDHNEYECIFRSGAHFAEEWIKVEDELPEQSPYLGKDRWGTVGLFKVTDKSFINAMDIVEWRPISRKTN